MFYYIDPGYDMELHAGKLNSKTGSITSMKYCECGGSWTRPAVRAVGLINGGLAFQGFQTITGNVFHCAVFFTPTKQAQLKIAATIQYTVPYIGWWLRFLVQIKFVT
jgi:hypothetical protein